MTRDLELGTRANLPLHGGKPQNKDVNSSNRGMAVANTRNAPMVRTMVTIRLSLQNKFNQVLEPHETNAILEESQLIWRAATLSQILKS